MMTKNYKLLGAAMIEVAIQIRDARTVSIKRVGGRWYVKSK